MKRKVKFAQYGTGRMGKYLMRYAIEHGAEPVAAFDMSDAAIGKDISDIMGISEPTGIKVSDSADMAKVIADTKPDVCIVATRSTVDEIFEPFSICAKNGVNAISTCEESLFPWNSAPKLAEELDALAKAGGCTLAGSGYPDLYWGVLITTIAASMNSIDKIKGSSSYNVEDYGIALAEGHGAGLTLEEFYEKLGGYNDYTYEMIQELIEKGEWIPSYMWTQNGWLASRLGLTIISQTQKNIPKTHSEDLHSKTLGMTIKAGNVTGMGSVVTTKTAEGVTLVTESIGKVYAPGEIDTNDWSLYGEPYTAIKVDNPATVELTCADIVNRIPVLIDSPSGYVSTDRMANGQYLLKPMEHYVNSI
ncbi:MAG: dihydrodipicolinate reductase [Clostridiales Family XIII bacterium]|jgi:4-hydroxy-tetrahydrodipicolinate reductase|nr:dihydrodipicolinate reductase [Clostridiales Family XIII bacterium]